MTHAVEPTLAALAKRDIEYRGVLYAGLMLTPEGTKVLEYNVRFGDPECQVVLPRLASDLAAHCSEAATGRLDDAGRRSPTTRASTVVLASEGYPASPRTGDVIDGLDAVGRARRRARVPRRAPTRDGDASDRRRPRARVTALGADDRRRPRPAPTTRPAGSPGPGCSTAPTSPPP